MNLSDPIYAATAEDAGWATVLGNGATAGTWGAAPAGGGVVVVNVADLAVLLDGACAGRCRCRN